MPDMLVHLLKLPPLSPLAEALSAQGVTIRRARPFEMSAIRAFIEEHFSVGWADEVMPCYSRQPITLFIAKPAVAEFGYWAAPETRGRGYTPRRAREQRAYRLAVTGAGAGIVGVVGIVLAVAGVVGAWLPIVALLVAAICAWGFTRAVGSR